MPLAQNDSSFIEAESGDVCKHDIIFTMINELMRTEEARPDMLYLLVPFYADP